jgi:hypothetical protein
VPAGAFFIRDSVAVARETIRAVLSIFVASRQQQQQQLLLLLLLCKFSVSAALASAFNCIFAVILPSPHP